MDFGSMNPTLSPRRTPRVRKRPESLPLSVFNSLYVKELPSKFETATLSENRIAASINEWCARKFIFDPFFSFFLGNQ